MHKMKNIEKLIALITISFVLGACHTIDRIKGNKPSCPSYNYSNFMGKTKEYLLAAKIKDEYVIVENGQNNDAVSYTHLDVYKRQVFRVQNY